MNPTDPPGLVVDADGWCQQAQQLRSPNCDPRPDGAVIDLLVVHNISLPPDEFCTHYIAALFLNRLDCDLHPYFDRLRGMRVSAHFLITRAGALLQFVSVNERAWHAGVSLFEGRERCNDFSIGIELEGSDFCPFADQQYETLAALAVALQQRYPLRSVAGHEHIAPGRKTDPGPCFDWPRLRAMLQVRQLASAPATTLSFPIKA
ncbi:1,6-anhydro-N-acetylmuramyl-L-alanine amidase AmpD [Lacisediminimonas sp.]|uniref:1,6-anhydro-N-acetylmuramyl-L-alanine amidase AmpD n=1 Tax=Lacisediminimonas sp. TaxID=3060582 RepID=UPI00272454B6|nr:1,6-anhydro-N-acetylmuramyl-L-alanine amidase AmpD [Lacisediminimonas sp.]MDO8300640.1 1,6-anhydro-N-acetylmuramyl-L-alanine amidase AmpD [Lacisediminimonas sp.]